MEPFHFPRFVKDPRRFQSPSFFVHEFAPTESLLGRWSRYCLKHSLSVREVVTMLAPFNARAPILAQESDVVTVARAASLPPSPPPSPAVWVNGQHRVSELLGLSASELACATGSILGDKSLCRIAFVPQLRWCPACLANGFHSIVFQHRAIRCCPYHGRPLLAGCPKCGQEHKPTYVSVARLPFGCPACDEVWLQPGSRPGIPTGRPVIGAMLQDRARELGITAPPQRNFITQSYGSVPYWLTPAACRNSARGLVWPLGISPYWPRFRTSTVLLTDWGSGSWLDIRRYDQVEAVRDSLRWLERTCGQYDDSKRLRHPGCTLPWVRFACSVSAIALHLTMAKYTKQRRRDQSPTPCAGPTEGIYGDVVWTGYQVSSSVFSSVAGNALIVQAEILAYFSLALLVAVRLAAVGRLHWTANFDRRNVSAVNWVVERTDSGYLLHFRPRASARFIQRLLHRYRDRKVNAWPDEVDIGQGRHWLWDVPLEELPTGHADALLRSQPSEGASSVGDAHT